MSTTIPSTNRKTLAAAHDAPLGTAAPCRLRGGEPRGRGLAMPPGAGRGLCKAYPRRTLRWRLPEEVPEKQPSPPRFAACKAPRVPKIQALSARVAAASSPGSRKLFSPDEEHDEGAATAEPLSALPEKEPSRCDE